MHPAGDDVFDPRTERVSPVGMSPLSRPDQGMPTARLHFQILVDELSGSPVEHIIQVGHPGQHPVGAGEGCPLRVHLEEVPARLVALDIERANMGLWQDSLQERPLLQIILMTGKQGIQIGPHGSVVGLLQLSGPDGQVQ